MSYFSLFNKEKPESNIYYKINLSKICLIPTPPTSHKSASAKALTLSANSWDTPYTPQGIPPPMHFPKVMISGCKSHNLVAPLNIFNFFFKKKNKHLRFIKKI